MQILSMFIMRFDYNNNLGKQIIRKKNRNIGPKKRIQNSFIQHIIYRNYIRFDNLLKKIVEKMLEKIFNVGLKLSLLV